MKHARGFGILSVLIWGAILGGAYYGFSIAPIYLDNLGFKQDARAVCNDWMSRTVSDPSELERRVRVKAQSVGIDPKELKIKIDTAENSVSIRCEYKRTWKLLFTDKQYARRFAWTVKQERG